MLCLSAATCGEVIYLFFCSVMFGWMFQSGLFGWFKNEQFLFVSTAVDGFQELLLEHSSCCFSVLTHKQQRALQRVPKKTQNAETYPQIMMSFLSPLFF